jgi:hypothetical protein
VTLQNGIDSLDILSRFVPPEQRDVKLAGNLFDRFAAHEELAPDPCNRVHALHPLHPS